MDAPQDGGGGALTLEGILQAAELADVVVTAAGLRPTLRMSATSATLAAYLRPGVAKLAEKLRICVVGGHSGRGQGPHKPIDTVALCNPAEGTWKVSSVAPTPRTDCAAAAADGMVYVLGGRDSEDVVLSAAERLDVARGCWQQLSPMAAARHSFAAAIVDGAVCVAGGYGSDTIEPLGLAEMMRHNRPGEECNEGGGWCALPSLPTARTSCTAAALHGVFYVFGGQDQGYRTLDAAERLVAPKMVPAAADAAALWAQLTAMPTRRSACAAAAVAGAIFVVGGIAGHSGALPMDTVERFDPKSGQWASLPPMIQPRRHFAAVGCAGRGGLYVLGGVTYAAKNIASVEFFDLASEQWKAAPRLPEPRSGCTAVAPWG